MITNESNANVVAGASNTNAPSEKVKSEVNTLKIVSSRTHVGPAVKGRKASTQLSSAANKIRLNNDLKVTVSNPGDEPERKPAQNSRSLEFKSGIPVPNALAIMEAWDELYGDKPGTPAYVEKANRLNLARSQVYASLGINPQKGVRPELTEEQRVAYSEAVKPYSFDYYEVRLSFKQAGRKAVRSKTYRYIDAPDLAAIQSQLIRRGKEVVSKFKITQ